MQGMWAAMLSAFPWSGARLNRGRAALTRTPSSAISRSSDAYAGDPERDHCNCDDDKIQCILRVACLTSQDAPMLIQSAVCRNGMEPLATLHHFVHPQWFEELGGFEKEENISLFLDWVRIAYV